MEPTKKPPKAKQDNTIQTNHIETTGTEQVEHNDAFTRRVLLGLDRVNMEKS